jgi:hypothetical protein
MERTLHAARASFTEEATMRHAAQRCAFAAAIIPLLAGAIACAADQPPTAPSMEPMFNGGDPCPTTTATASFGRYPGHMAADDYPPPPEPCNFVDGRMTGGGGQIIIGDVFVSRGLTIHCDIVLSNNLEINWEGNHWHLDKPLTSATCIDDPAFNPIPPRAPFDTFIGVGDGRLNGVDGSVVMFTFIDNGEPGRTDMASIQIFDASGALVLDVPLSNLDRGNLQAHYDQPHGSNGN